MRSLSWRLTVWYAVILLLILLLCGVAAFWGMRYLLYSEAAHELSNALATLQRLAGSEPENGDLEHMDLEDPELVVVADNGLLMVQIVAADGRVLNKSRSLGQKLLPRQYSGPPAVLTWDGQKIMLAGAWLAGGARVQIARPLVREDGFLHTLLLVLALLGCAGLVLAVAGGRLISRAALQPVYQLINMARQITTSDLSRRIQLPVVRDELYLLAENFNQMLDRLEQGFKSQQEFVTAASHDLRTPLTVIKSYTDMLRRWGKEDPQVLEEAVVALGRAVHVMERLVNDLLLLARMQTGLPLNMLPVALGELVSEIAREAAAVAGNVTVYQDVQGNPVVMADEHYLRRALWALVDNAIKYNRPQGEVVIKLEQALGQTPGRAQAIISVTDTGPGIPEEKIPRLFERFYRGDPARGSRGFGLGLALAREIVEAHKGRMEVSSRLGEGSCFKMILPLPGQDDCTR
ncbi:MAG: ATP-binding protein [Bacillota bacterium]